MTITRTFSAFQKVLKHENAELEKTAYNQYKTVEQIASVQQNALLLLDVTLNRYTVSRPSTQEHGPHGIPDGLAIWNLTGKGR